MSRILVADIILALADRYDVTQEEVISEGRSARIYRVRAVGMWLARRLTGQSMPMIGRAFGDRDHTTVLHSLRRVEEGRQRSPEARAELALLELVIRAASGAATHPFDRCLDHIDICRLARDLLARNDREANRAETVALARAVLTLARRAEAAEPAPARSGAAPAGARGMKLNPAQQERVVALARKGLPPRSIVVAMDGAARIGDVYALLTAARKLDTTIPRFGAGDNGRSGKADPQHDAQTAVLVPTSLLTRLRPHAARRDIGVDHLVRALLTTIADENLVNATLDDGVTS